jgi:hypothetical protein
MFRLLLILASIFFAGCTEVASQSALETEPPNTGSQSTEPSGTRTDSSVEDQPTIKGASFVETTSADWPQFRGLGGLGVAQATSLPTTWSQNENLACLFVPFGLQLKREKERSCNVAVS